MPWEETDGMDDMTAAQIIGKFCKRIARYETVPTQTYSDDLIQALTAAGKIIVDRALLQQLERALVVALEISGKAFENARGVEHSGSPGEGQWEDMHQIDHALNQLRAMTKDTGS